MTSTSQRYSITLVADGGGDGYEADMGGRYALEDHGEWIADAATLDDIKALAAEHVEGFEGLRRLGGSDGWAVEIKDGTYSGRTDGW